MNLVTSTVPSASVDAEAHIRALSFSNAPDELFLFGRPVGLGPEISALPAIPNALFRSLDSGERRVRNENIFATGTLRSGLRSPDAR